MFTREEVLLVLLVLVHFNEARTQQLVPLGNSNSLLITAPASMATNIVEMFERADEESAKAAKAQNPSPKPVEPPAPAK